MAKLKVFGGLVMVSQRGQLRTIVASTSRAKVVAALAKVGIHTTTGTIAAYWSETGNAHELNIALPNPGAVFQARNWDERDYVELQELL